LSGLSCFARDGFYDMARSSSSKKSHRSNSDSDSEVRYVTSFPSCVKRMRSLASCLITVERQKR
jgi:hypothetical protein